MAVQLRAAGAGFPCARPLTGVSYLDGHAVHAEQWRPGGEMLRGNGTAIAERFARLYAELMAATGAAQLLPPLPNPEWAHWDHIGPGIWPPNERHDSRPRVADIPPALVENAGVQVHVVLAVVIDRSASFTVSKCFGLPRRSAMSIRCGSCCPSRSTMSSLSETWCM